MRILSLCGTTTGMGGAQRRVLRYDADAGTFLGDLFTGAAGEGVNAIRGIVEGPDGRVHFVHKDRCYVYEADGTPVTDFDLSALGTLWPSANMIAVDESAVVWVAFSGLTGGIDPQPLTLVAFDVGTGLPTGDTVVPNSDVKFSGGSPTSNKLILAFVIRGGNVFYIYVVDGGQPAWLLGNGNDAIRVTDLSSVVQTPLVTDLPYALGDIRRESSDAGWFCTAYGNSFAAPSGILVDDAGAASVVFNMGTGSRGWTVRERAERAWVADAPNGIFRFLKTDTAFIGSVIIDGTNEGLDNPTGDDETCFVTGTPDPPPPVSAFGPLIAGKQNRLARA